MNKKIIKKIIIASSVFFIVIFTGGYALIYTKTTHVKELKARSFADILPENTGSFIEIKNPAETKSIFDESDFGKEIRSSEQWRRLLATPEAKKFLNILYILQLKSGLALDIDDLAGFFSGPAGAAKLDNGHFIIGGWMNLKSSFGAAIFSAFRGKQGRITDDEGARQDAAKTGEKAVSHKDYKTIFSESSLDINDLKVSRIKINEGFIYLIMLNDLLMISDDSDTIVKSIAVALNGKVKSFRGRKGADALVFGEDDRICLYLGQGGTSFSPIIRVLTNSEGIAFMLNFGKGKPVTADIHYIGLDENVPVYKTGENSKWENNLHSGIPAIFYTNNTPVTEAIKALAKMGPGWDDFNESVRNFFSGAGINPAEYFGTSKGFSVSFSGSLTVKEQFYPGFGLCYSSARSDDSVITAIFKSRTWIEKKFQGVRYISLNMKENQNYSPAYLFKNERKFITSFNQDIEKVISAQNGNRPRLSDMPSFGMLGKFRESPNGIIFDIHSVFDEIRNFLYYGAVNSPDYTNVTIDRDIIPLFEPFKKYRTVHIAFGVDGKGKMVISDK